MNRRTFVRFAALIPFAVALAPTYAQGDPAIDHLKPYLQVPPVPGEANTVRGFFSPHCPYSKAYGAFFRNLATTLPAGRTFLYTPLVNTQDGIAYALAFMAVRRYYPTYLPNFVEASLIGAQDRGLSTANWAGIDRIAKAAHVPTSVPALVAAHMSVLQRDVRATIRLQHDLGITNTPTIAVAGTYIVTPEFTNGDPALFSQLVNGIISMAQ